MLDKGDVLQDKGNINVVNLSKTFLLSNQKKTSNTITPYLSQPIFNFPLFPLLQFILHHCVADMVDDPCCSLILPEAPSSPEKYPTEEPREKFNKLQSELGLSQLPPDISAMRLINILTERKIDFTLLFFLQLPACLVNQNPCCQALLKFCDENSIVPVGNWFFDTVRRQAEERKIREITPSHFVVASRKKKVLSAYKGKEWGVHCPFFFQTYADNTKGANSKGMRDSLFFITRTWQDGVIMLLRILQEKGYATGGQYYEAIGAVEHVVDESSLFYALFDCEQVGSAYQGRLSSEKIDESMQTFPETMLLKMVETKILDCEQIVHVHFKHSSRCIDADSANADIKF